MTEAELQAIRQRAKERHDCREPDDATDAFQDRDALLAEIDRLRATSIELTAEDKDSLARFLARSFDEGCLDADGGWPREEVLRFLGIDERSHLWSYFIRDTQEA